MLSIDQPVLMGAAQTSASWVGPGLRRIYSYQDMTKGLAKDVLICRLWIIDGYLRLGCGQDVVAASR
jgi:hypothetical protein